MKACNACHINVRTRREACPLCGTPLSGTPLAGKTPQPPALPQDDFPDLSGLERQYNLMLRIFVFLSLLGCGVSVLVNLLVPTGFWWCLIVVAAVAYLWVTVPPLLRRGVNYAKRTVFMTIFTAALATILDGITGWYGWSVSFVLPGILMAGIIAIGFLMVFHRTSRTQYIFYQLLMGLFGFIPLALYLLDIAQNLPMVLVTAALALASVLVTVVFGDRTLKNDFRRRFNI